MIWNSRRFRDQVNKPTYKKKSAGQGACLLFLTLPIEVNWKLILFCFACIPQWAFIFLEPLQARASAPVFKTSIVQDQRSSLKVSLAPCLSASSAKVLKTGPDLSKTTESLLVKSYLWWMFSRVDSSTPFSRWKTYLAVIKKLYRPFVDILWRAADDWIEHESF